MKDHTFKLLAKFEAFEQFAAINKTQQASAWTRQREQELETELVAAVGSDGLATLRVTSRLCDREDALLQLL